jgi:hypothetical protein
MPVTILGERGRACTRDLYCYRIQIVTTLFRNICDFALLKYISFPPASRYSSAGSFTQWVKLDRV